MAKSLDGTPFLFSGDTSGALYLFFEVQCVRCMCMRILLRARIRKHFPPAFFPVIFAKNKQFCKKKFSKMFQKD